MRLSRNSPDEILGTSNSSSLAARVRMANSWPADYFISIHCNSNVNPAINGTEVYVFQQNTQPYWLAQHVLIGIVERVGTKDNGVRLNPSLFVLRRTSMPAILVELAYLSNAVGRPKAARRPVTALPRGSTMACSAISALPHFDRKKQAVQRPPAVFTTAL